MRPRVRTPMELTGLAGAVALVTGAAGGIGGAVAAGLAAAGATVAATDADADALDRATRGRAGDLRAWTLDVRDEERVERTVADVEARLGPIAVLVNAAGVLGPPAPLLAQGPADFDRVFGVNVLGPMLCGRAVARHMVPRRRGCIITVASNSAAILKVDQALYGASKAAARYLTNCLGLELAEHGIRCVVVSPGTTNTAMAASRGPERARTLVRGDATTYRPGIPLGRLAEPADIADAVLFLASDQARHITCTELTVDGGATLRPG